LIKIYKFIILIFIFKNYTSYPASYLDKNSEDQCSICCDRIVDVKLQCQHKLCLPCTKKINEDTKKCPFCRIEIEYFTHIEKETLTDSQQSSSSGWLSASSDSEQNSTSENDSYYQMLPDERKEIQREYFRLTRLGKYSKLVEMTNENFINIKDEHGNTPLIVAAQNNRKRTIKFLIAKGSDPNIQNKSGQTALHYAFSYRYFDLAETLLELGASDTILNNRGLDPYDGLN